LSLPIGREEQKGVVIWFAERRVGEGLVDIPEGRVTVLKIFWSASTTCNVLIELP
jgi:hypothetical protein